MTESKMTNAQVTPNCLARQLRLRQFVQLVLMDRANITGTWKTSFLHQDVILMQVVLNRISINSLSPQLYGLNPAINGTNSLAHVSKARRQGLVASSLSLTTFMGTLSHLALRSKLKRHVLHSDTEPGPLRNLWKRVCNKQCLDEPLHLYHQEAISR